MTPADCLARDATGLCKALNLDPSEARREIQVLLGSVLGVNRAWLIAHDAEALTADALTRYEELLARRASGEPVAYLLGEKEFFGRNFKVAPGVLVPRPETELLVELALEKINAQSVQRILDLGTGSGCIAITLALESAASVVAVDCSRTALDIAQTNARQLNVAVRFFQGGWYQALPDEMEKFDLIVSNPPYIEEGDAHLTALAYEPISALSSGADGLQDIRSIVQGAHRCLASGGWLMLEHGWDQAGRVQALLKEQGFVEVETRADLAGIGRVTLGKLA